MAKHLPHAGRPRHRWLPKVLTRIAKPKPRKPRYDSDWTILAGGLAYVQDQHSEDHVALEEDIYSPLILQEAKANGAPMVTFHQPDRVTERRLIWSGLSEEARYVINLILSGPAEALEVIMTPKRKAITQSAIRSHLHQRGLPRKAVNATMDEITEYVRAL